MELVKLGVFPLNDAKHLESQLAILGVQIVMEHNSATCSRGSCGVTVEVSVPLEHLPTVSRLITQSFAKNLGKAEFDISLLENVYDPAQSEAVCPACGFKFATTEKACPDCGLVLG